MMYKLVILLVEESADIPSNLRDQRHIIYHGSITQLHEALTRYLPRCRRNGLDDFAGPGGALV